MGTTEPGDEVVGGFSRRRFIRTAGAVAGA